MVSSLLRLLRRAPLIALTVLAGAAPAAALSCAGFPKATLVLVDDEIVPGVEACRLIPITLGKTPPRLSVATRDGDITLTGVPRPGLRGTVRVLVKSRTLAQGQRYLREVRLLLRPPLAVSLPFPLAGQTSSVDYDLVTRAGMPVLADTESGDLTIRDFVGSVEGRVQSGDLTYRGGQGTVRLSAASGDIVAALTGGGWRGGSFEANAIEGDVTLTRPRGYAAAFTAISSGALILDGREIEDDDDPVTRRFGSGRSVTVRSEDGTVRLRRR